MNFMFGHVHVSEMVKGLDEKHRKKKLCTSLNMSLNIITNKVNDKQVLMCQ